MKRLNTKKITTGILSLVLVATSSFPAFAATGLGNVVYEEASYIAPDVTYKKQIAFQNNGNRQSAFTIEFNTLTGKLAPYVFTGNVTSKYTLSNKINTLKNQGYNVIAGINGDFYNVSTGVPLGLTIHDGKIKTSGVNSSNVLAFNQDGTAFMAGSNLEYNMTINGGAGVGTIGLINKMQGDSTSVNFYNSEFGATTLTSKNSVEVVVSAPEGAEPFIGGIIKGTVKSVNMKAKATALMPGEFVLSTDASKPNAKYLESIKIGDEIAVSVVDKSTAGNWNQVKECIGAYQNIVKNGVVNTTDKTSNPRTCVGIKGDGSLLIYVVDGRQTGYSVGMNLVDIANYMIEQGCVNVANFDGGGSTTMSAKMPWEQTAGLVNKPSGGVQRAVSNSLIFVAKETGDGVAQNISMTQKNVKFLTGAQNKFNAVLSDSMYTLVPFLEGDIRYVKDTLPESMGAASVGMVDEKGYFIAGTSSASGQIKAVFGEKESAANITVLSVDQAMLSLNGPNDAGIQTPVNGNVNVKPGATKDFNMVVTDAYKLPVIASDAQFLWYSDTNIGTIDENGKFTASTEVGAEGKIKVYYSTSQSGIVSQSGITTSSGLTSEGGIITTPEAISVEPGKLIKEFSVIVGNPPLILADFESGIAGWTTGGMSMGTNGVAIKQETFAAMPENVFFGKGSLKIYYDMKTKGYKKGAAGAYAIKPIAMTGYPKKIGMWVYGDGKGHWLRSQIKDAAGTTVLIDYTDDKVGVNWTGWKYVEATVPTGLKAPLTLDIPVRYMEKVEANKGKGSIWIDNIRAVYDYVNDDKVAPTMDAPSITTDATITSKSEFTIQMYDDIKGSGINWDRVKLFLDDKEIVKGIVKNTDNDGVLRWNMINADPVKDGKHTIKVVVKDNFQNTTTMQWEYGFVK